MKHDEKQSKWHSGDAKEFLTLPDDLPTVLGGPCVLESVGS